MELSAVLRVLLLGFTLSVLAGPVGGVTTAEIYSIDSLVQEHTVHSLEAAADGVSVLVQPFNNNAPAQRFVGRLNQDNTFSLFLEVQPWEWVNYIDEKTHKVNIKDKVPKVLEAVGGTVRQLVQADYNGSTGQNWYLVPTGADPETGLITNLNLRLCILNNGPGANVTVVTCSLTDPQQVFRFTRRSQGRCY